MRERPDQQVVAETCRQLIVKMLHGTAHRLTFKFK